MIVITQEIAQLKEQLAEGIAALSLSLSDLQQDQLLGYVALLEKWNKVYNLTSVREPQSMLVQHILDSLAIVPVLDRILTDGATLLDVGSGPGLPALPLAIARPSWKVFSLDGHHKRTAFVQQVVIELGISNVIAVQERVEAWQAPHSFDVVVSRAFAELNDFVQLAQRHVANGGVMLAMKGVYPYEEIERLVESLLHVTSVEALDVPFLEAQRHAVILRHRDA